MNATWDGLLAGRSGIQRHGALLPSESYLVDLAGMVEGYGPGGPDEDPAISRLAARSIHLALAAARQAWNDAGLDGRAGDYDSDRVALAIGSAFGGLDLLEVEQAKSARRKSLAASPYLIPGLLANQPLAQVAEQLGMHGPSVAPVNACATGGHALALGAMFLKAGEADIALCGGVESAFTPMIVNGFATMKAMVGRKGDDRSVEHPSQASRPFSVDRAGFVMSEGAGMVVLARESVARKLGLEIQAILAGWALNTDGYHMAMPDPTQIARCLAQSLRRAELRPAEVDYYNAHGTSTVVNDRVETRAIKDVFGDHAAKLPVSSIKGALGHALGAASAIEAACCVRVLRDQVLPPTINHRPDPELDLDYVPDQARPASVNAVMSASFGFGGTNNALILTRGDR
jgi:3-oxoacyl-[acyl-carrier-protein] synthase II